MRGSDHVADLRTVSATRYVTPLREGGSLPGLLEADDDGLYVVKFRGAGQGSRALVAEVIAGELARALGLPIPEQAIVPADWFAGERPETYVDYLARRLETPRDFVEEAERARAGA